MVDHTKRRALLAIGGVITVPLVPAMATAANDSAGQHLAKTNLPVTSALVNDANSDLTISLFFDGSLKMRVTNATSKLQILRRIQPGVVDVGGKSYDLNQSLLNSAYAIGSGKSRLIPISESNSTAAASALAKRYSGRSLKEMTITQNNVNGSVLNTTQGFFA